MKRFCFSILAGLLTACSTPLPPRPPASTLVPRAAAPKAAPSAVLKPARIEAADSYPELLDVFPDKPRPAADMLVRSLMREIGRPLHASPADFAVYAVRRHARNRSR
jgi:hypothetical protein